MSTAKQQGSGRLGEAWFWERCQHHMNGLITDMSFPTFSRKMGRVRKGSRIRCDSSVSQVAIHVRRASEVERLDQPAANLVSTKLRRLFTVCAEVEAGRQSIRDALRRLREGESQLMAEIDGQIAATLVDAASLDCQLTVAPEAIPAEKTAVQQAEHEGKGDNEQTSH